MKDFTTQAMGNPMAGNPFATRADAQQAAVDLTAPLLEAFSPGCARVTLGATGAHFHAAAADLEGLGEEVRKKVFQHSGIELHWEIMRVGEPALP